MSENIRFCPRCKQLLAIEAFIYPKSGRIYGSYCRKCQIEYQRERSMSHINKKPTECAICSVPFNTDLPNVGGVVKHGIFKPHADHNHNTGTFRDWLCEGCNKGLGHFYESPAALRKAADYLEQHENDDTPTELALSTYSVEEKVRNHPDLIKQLLDFQSKRKQ